MNDFLYYCPVRVHFGVGGIMSNPTYAKGLEINEEILRKVTDTCGLSEGNVRKLDRDEVFDLLKEVL